MNSFRLGSRLLFGVPVGLLLVELVVTLGPAGDSIEEVDFSGYAAGTRVLNSWATFQLPEVDFRTRSAGMVDVATEDFAFFGCAVIRADLSGALASRGQLAEMAMDLADRVGDIAGLDRRLVEMYGACGDLVVDSAVVIAIRRGSVQFNI